MVKEMKINGIFQDKVICFNFGIIEQPDGLQVIDSKLKTPMDSLTYDMQQEYLEVNSQLAISERMKREKNREEERKKRLEHNLLYRIACFCGII